jgi:hypothetical protein
MLNLQKQYKRFINNKVNGNNICSYLNSGELHIEISNFTRKIIAHPCCYSWLNSNKVEKYSFSINETINKIEQSSVADVLNDFFKNSLNSFFEDGYCLSKKVCQANIIETNDNIKIKKLTISTSSACNLKCKMCRSEIKTLNDDELKITKILFEGIKGMGLNTISTTYLGEPFMIPFMKEWLLSLNKNDTENVVILTNGTLLTEKDIYTLYSEMNKNGVKLLFQISIDGICKETYEKIRVGADFEHIIKIAKYMNSLGILININYVLQNSNLHELPYIKKYFINQQLPEPNLLINHFGADDCSAAYDFIKKLSINDLNIILSFDKIFNITKEQIINEIDSRK